MPTLQYLRDVRHRLTIDSSLVNLLSCWLLFRRQSSPTLINQLIFNILSRFCKRDFRFKFQKVQECLSVSFFFSEGAQNLTFFSRKIIVTVYMILTPKIVHYFKHDVNFNPVKFSCNSSLKQFLCISRVLH